MTISPSELDRDADLLTQQADALSAKKKFGQAGQKQADARKLRAQAKEMRAYGYPYDVADGKTDTSAKAATKMRKKVGKYHMMVMDVLKYKNMTNSEIFEHYRVRQQDQDYYSLRELERSLQPRAGELEKMGLVKNTGDKRKNRNGNLEIVWSLV